MPSEPPAEELVAAGAMPAIGASGRTAAENGDAGLDDAILDDAILGAAILDDAILDDILDAICAAI